ncbi:hypothetical protein ACQKGO_26755 [Corallococcus interemptor]|uniref:hypothetical protein n=1 Tax=Corallococcus interemptor TaxID=2316720 RepID=UPI003D00EA1B
MLRGVHLLHQLELATHAHRRSAPRPWRFERVYPVNASDFHRLVEIVLVNLLDLHQQRGSKPEGGVLERINAFKVWRPGECLLGA